MPKTKSLLLEPGPALEVPVRLREIVERRGQVQTGIGQPAFADMVLDVGLDMGQTVDFL